MFRPFMKKQLKGQKLQISNIKLLYVNRKKILISSHKIPKYESTT
jgi:hypothetical protein